MEPAPELADRNPSVSPRCPIAVDRASMVMEWNQLTFLHWDFDPAVVQRLLPAGLTVDTFDGRAWVGLVPFLMVVRAARGGTVPWLSSFCETNVRTYAVGPDGSRGVWFLSLDASRLPAVAAARSAFALPYFWSSMGFGRTFAPASDAAPDHQSSRSVPRTVTYRNRRRWPGPRGASSLVRMNVGRPFRPDELGPLDHFLTARWRLYAQRPSGLRWVLAQHDPWVLHQTDVVDLDDQLITAAGLRARPDRPCVTGHPEPRSGSACPAVSRPADWRHQSRPRPMGPVRPDRRTRHS